MLNTSQSCPSAGASIGVTYKTIYVRTQGVRTFFVDILKTSSGRHFAQVVDTMHKK